VVVGTEFVYLNGLLQKSGDDYTYQTDGDGNIGQITFLYDPEGGRVQIAGQVVA
jgi:hypothetical protein